MVNWLNRNVKFSGEYQSTVDKVNACRQIVYTELEEVLEFPPAYERVCEGCGKYHGFIFIRVISVPTPGAYAALKVNADRMHIVFDVVSPIDKS